MTLPKDWDKSKINSKSKGQSTSPRTMRILKFIIPLLIIFIIWMVARAAVNSGFDEADKMLARGCYYTSTDWLGVGKDWICP
jgi:hypothetical protein